MYIVGLFSRPLCRRRWDLFLKKRSCVPPPVPRCCQPKQYMSHKVFLHVNEINEAALRLYASCGYDEAPDCASNRAFTNSLGLSGGFIGQRHRLLHKTFPIADASGSSGTP